MRSVPGFAGLFEAVRTIDSSKAPNTVCNTILVLAVPPVVNYLQTRRRPRKSTKHRRRNLADHRSGLQPGDTHEGIYRGAERSKQEQKGAEATGRIARQSTKRFKLDSDRDTVRRTLPRHHPLTSRARSEDEVNWNESRRQLCFSDYFFSKLSWH